MKHFENKVIVITGAGSGIGRALAVAFSKKGAKLALNDFNEATLLETVETVGGQKAVFYKAFDVANKASFYQFAEDVVAHYGQVDVVINNAGVAISKLAADEISIEDYEWIFGINLWGMMYGTLAFLPHLRKQKESSIVNLSSIFGVHGIPDQAAYCTTKFGIRGFTESLAIEEKLKKTGVSVTSVHPGGIKTNIARSSRHAVEYDETIQKFEKKFITTPEKAAETIIKGIQRKKMRVLVGPDAKFLYLLNKLPQRIIVWLLMRMAKDME